MARPLLSRDAARAGSGPGVASAEQDRRKRSSARRCSSPRMLCCKRAPAKASSDSPRSRRRRRSRAWRRVTRLEAGGPRRRSSIPGTETRRAGAPPARWRSGGSCPLLQEGQLVGIRLARRLGTYLVAHDGEDWPPRAHHCRPRRPPARTPCGMDGTSRDSTRRSASQTSSWPSISIEMSRRPPDAWVIPGDVVRRLSWISSPADAAPPAAHSASRYATAARCRSVKPVSASDRHTGPQ